MVQQKIANMLSEIVYTGITNLYIITKNQQNIKGTDQAGTVMSLKCVVYYANYRSGHQSSKIQVVP